jgi:hypothetical protein
MWARVGGDALDLVALAALGASGARNRDRWVMAMAAVAAVATVDVAAARRLASAPSTPARDYSHRSGFPRPVEEMRGAAADFRPPRDMQIPEPLRPLNQPARIAGNAGSAASLSPA